MADKEILSHVLYIDDDADMRMLVQLSLENVGGMRVTLCETAINLLEGALAEKPQLTILDAMMPGMDGLAILQAMKADARLADIPVIFLTGKTKTEEIESFKALGAIGVLAKPFDLVALPVQVRDLWEKNR